MKEKKAVADEKPAARVARTVKAKTRMENIALNDDGTTNEKLAWVINEGDMVSADHIAVKLHPTWFEGV